MKEYIVNPEDEHLFYGNKYEELIRCENCAHYGNPLMCPLYRISPPYNGYCYCAKRRKE